MNGEVIRDPAAMMRFAEDLEEYITSVQKECRQMRDAADYASPRLADDSMKKALSQLRNLADIMEEGLPVAADLAGRLRNSAKPLMDLQGLF